MTTTYVDAEPVRQHVRALMAQGMGRPTIATASGVADQTLCYILYGDARFGNRPSRRVHVMNAKRILAVTYDQAHLSDYAMIDGIGVRRRLQALMAQGWTNKDIAERLGCTRGWVNALIKGYKPRVLVQTHRDVVAVHREMWEQEPPQDTPQQRTQVARAKGRARKYGYMPTAAWDDIDRDETPPPAPPIERDYVDPERVRRLVDGQKVPGVTLAEKRESARILLRRGESKSAVERQLGMSYRTVRLVAA